MTLNTPNIPDELKGLPQWVLYDTNKIPHQPSGRKASSTDPGTWTTFDDAVANLNGFAGVGIILTKDDPIVGVDLDGCRNAKTGVVERWAMEIVESLDGYTEVSPSGEGLHILARADKTDLPANVSKRHGQVECYTEKRYFTVTGDVLPGYERLRTSTDAVAAFMRKHLAREKPRQEQPKPSAPVSLSDADLLDKAKRAKNGAKFTALFDEGDWEGQGFPSPSEADLALCRMLAYWTGCDADRIDRLFRQSKLMRPKWERQDIRQGTIEKAIAGTSEAYAPQGSGGGKALKWDSVICEAGQTPDEPKREAPGGPLLPPPVDIAAWIGKAPPAREYLFDGLVARGTMMGVFAQGGSGKGWLAQVLITSVAIGRALLPSCRPTTEGPVLWVESEDSAEELHRRHDSIMKHFEVSDDEQSVLADRVRILADHGFPLVQTRDRVVEPTDYLTELRLVVEEMEPALIVIDPLAHFFACDENSNTEMAAAMNHLKRLTDSGGVLLLNHHTSKARAYEADSAAGRGASAIRDGLRAVFSLTPHDDPFLQAEGVVCLSHTKSNYAARMSCPIFLKRHQTGVLAEIGADSVKAREQSGKRRSVLVALVNEIGENAENLSENEILYKKGGKLLRETLKATFGLKYASRSKLKALFDEAVKGGELVLDADTPRGPNAKVYRKVEGKALAWDAVIGDGGEDSEGDCTGAQEPRGQVCAVA